VNKHHAMRPNSIVGSCWVLCGPTLQKMHDVKYMTKSSTQLLHKPQKLIPTSSFRTHNHTTPPPPLLWTTYLPTILWPPSPTLMQAFASLSLSKG